MVYFSHRIPALKFLGVVHLFAGGGFAGFDHFGEAVEEVGGVVGAGAGFGVVLDGEDGFRFVAEAFEGVVVEVDVGGLAAFAGEGGGVDGEAVVLTGDFDLAGAGVADGLVAAAVAEFEACRLWRPWRGPRSWWPRQMPKMGFLPMSFFRASCT